MEIIKNQNHMTYHFIDYHVVIDSVIDSFNQYIYIL